ncbi:hypothetical protein GFC01_13570 [Desulfofundulus thermobenzoicus]|uniref:Uncharacterized protein n=1 Tax=Desulfofundulus thermobenzoicus TaxID=29376 RepID=A0A6N7IT18_9FIRM|nr:hypothetical protein [Desulfofundulus thermobenzoicus]MQL53266.1 hypothetical protein [Desulfofundulus thermobenzoicus]
MDYIRKALTIEEAFWRSERERSLYELREKALRDELVMLEGARAEGIGWCQALNLFTIICLWPVPPVLVLTGEPYLFARRSREERYSR